MLRSLLFILLMMLDVGWIHCLCVYEQDFGFTLDCAFKKSTLFRIRNLGGVKGYVGIGFTVGDDLKFKESLSQEADATRRRSAPNPTGDVSRADSATGRSHSGRNPLLAWSTAGGIPGQLPAAYPGNVGVFPAPMGPPAMPTVPPFKPLGGGSSAASKTAGDDLVTVPPFSALPPSIARIPTIKKVQVPVSPLVFQQTAFSQMANRRHQTSASDLNSDIPNRNNIVQSAKISEPPSSLKLFEASDAMPTDTLSTRRLNESPSQSSATAQAAVYPSLSQDDDLDISNPSPLLMGHSVQSLSQASNISVEALAAALRLREQQLLASVAISTTTTTTTTTTTPRPTKPPTIRPKYPLVGPNRVMNAPKEYYPVSYDKNYDDNFTSKVELPETSFSCGDQKHFPGLYADEDLGCMVFHVCAFTDDGMVQKSFLCPESTLFDQSILKCNWWFYVDCKSSKRLYDSNIPISKSYQLMKALAFFSSYKNQTTNNST